MSKQRTVAQAKQALELRGWKFVKTCIVAWRYDWNTTYRQGDVGVCRERRYLFTDPSGQEVTMSTKGLRNRA